MKRSLPSLFLGVLLLSTAGFAQDCDLTGWRFYVDPGHGGSDSGAVGPTGLREKDVNLDVGLQLRDWLQYFGAAVGISRTTDVFVSLTARANMANSFGADRFSSVHMNGFGQPQANGTEVYVVPNPRPVTRDLGQQILDQLLAYIGLTNRGLKFARFAVLVRTTMPAALSESAFITNPGEEALLRDPAVRSAIAEAHAYGICNNAYAFGGIGEPEDSVPSDTLPQFHADRLRSEAEGLIFIGRMEGPQPLLGPRFSPDGNLLAFSESSYRGLYITDVSNFQMERLSTDPAAGFDFSWSPDGQAIAFATRQGKGYVVRLARIEGKIVEAILSPSAYPVRPEFQPDGDLLVVNADTGDTTRISRGQLGLNGRVTNLPSMLASIRDGQVWLDKDGERKQLTNDGFSYSDPQLSPMKDKVLVTGSDSEGSHLFVIELETNRKHDLSTLGVGRQGEFNLGYEGTWSPDGARVLFSLVRDNGYIPLASDLYLINFDGTNLVPLTSDGAVKLHPDWSARNQIAFEDAEGRIVIAALR